jgi:hypothetical protein
MTKFANTNNRKKPDTPLAISGEQFTGSERRQYFCSYCQYNLTKINDSEYYCKHCSLFQYPDIENVRSKSRITTPIGLSTEPLVSYPEDPDARFYKDKPEIKGGLKLLKQKGIKITWYSETGKE